MDQCKSVFFRVIEDNSLAVGQLDQKPLPGKVRYESVCRRRAAGENSPILHEDHRIVSMDLMCPQQSLRP